MENGPGHKRVALYIRVSTDEQSERGYSIPDQKRDLTTQVNREGWSLIESVVDDGYSGAVGSRPGLDRIMELAEGGKIDIVLAKKRNRFFRSRYHRLVYERSLNDLGINLIALDDTGNRFADAMNDEFADWYRDEVTKNTKAGRLEKARQGKIIASHTPIYGFAYTDTRDRYVVSERAMSVVRRAIEELAQGKPIHRVKRGFEADGIPSPAGRVLWEHKTIKEFAREDAYYPLPYYEIAPMLTAEARERLDPEGEYGIVWYPRRRVKSLEPDPSKGYRRGQSVTLYAREEQVPIPVPSSGIPAEVIDAARRSISTNKMNKRRSNGGKIYELSGFLRCASCGRLMTGTHTARNGKRFFYYRCAHYKREGLVGCEMNRSIRAGELEQEVLHAVLDAVKNKDELAEKAREEYEGKKRALFNGSLTDIQRLYRRLDEIEGERLEFFRQSARGRLTDDALDALLVELDDEKKRTQQSIDVYTERSREADRLEKLYDKSLTLIREGRWTELGITAPEARRERYQEIGLEAVASRDGRVKVSWSVGTKEVSFRTDPKA